MHIRTSQSTSEATVIEHTLRGSCFALHQTQYLHFEEVHIATYRIDVGYNANITSL
jgi:hypothetical protein